MAGKKTGKRLLTWVLVLVMALSLLPLNALADDIPTEYSPTIEWKYAARQYHSLTVEVIHEGHSLGTISSTDKHSSAKVELSNDSIEVYDSDATGGSYSRRTAKLFTFGLGSTEGYLKLYTRSTAGHEVTVNYVFNDGSGRTKTSKTQVKYQDEETFPLAEKNYSCTFDVTSGDAKAEKNTLGRLAVTGGTEDSVVTVTYTPENNIYIDKYFNNGTIFSKWNGEKIKLNGYEFVENNKLAEKSVIANSDLTPAMKDYRFLTVTNNGIVTVYDFSYAVMLPKPFGKTNEKLTDVWYDLDAGQWYYSHLNRSSKLPVVNEGSINFCYNTVHSENSTHHMFELVKTVAPTCTEGGYSLYKCAYCEMTEQRNQTAALDHDWGSWTHDIATTGAESTHTRICKSDASHTETKSCTFTEDNGTFTCKDCDYSYDTYTAPTYPVYVYAFFAHNGKQLTDNVTVNGKPIEWNEDANNEEYKEYFVTLGVYPNGTTKEPTDGNTRLDLEALKGKKYELFDGTGSGKVNSVALNDITVYPSPSGKVCKGAAGYPDRKDILSWHLDGQVDVYTVTYDDGMTEGEPTSNGYYFGSYTIAAAPKRDGYTFTGWKDDNGDVYDAGSKIDKLSKDLNLVAQWTARTDLSYTVNHLWGNESIGSTTGEAEYGYTITPSTSFDGYTLISGQTTTYTITEDGRVFNLYYYKNVTLTANSDTKIYDGKEHTVTGYTAKDNKDNLVEGLTFIGVDSPSVSGTDVGEYDVTFSANPVGTYNNLYYVTAVNPGKLTINKRSVTLTSETASKAYDGTPLTRPNVTVGGDGFVEGEVTDIRATGSVTYVSEGEVTNTIEYTPTDKFKADNYDIIKTEGKLTITEASAPTPGTFDFNDVVYGDGKNTPAITKTVKGNVGKNFKESFEVTVKPKSENAIGTMSSARYTGEAKVIASKSLKDVPFLFKPEAMANAVVPYGKLRFTEAGIYTYTVQEVPGGTSRMSYDTTEYTLTINVVLDEDSNTYQVKSWQFTPGNREYHDTLNIVNTYRTYHPSTPSKPTLNTGDHYAYVMGYPDGTVRPNGSITRAEVSTILFRMLSDKTRDEYFTTESSFTDVKAGAWYNNSIATLEKAGVIVDTAKGGAFRPNEAITRAELAAMLAQFSDTKPVKGVKFSDVSAEHWAYEAIAIAAKMGWIEGYPDGTFRPDATITRAEMMTLVNRALERVPSDEDHLLSKRVMLTFPDCKSGDWFYIAVQEATNSHTYERAATEKNGDEQWTALRANRDWTLLEK